MNEQQNFKYYVIEVLEPEHPNAERYMCVPNSWSRLCEGVSHVALVKLPIEDLSNMKKRVQRGEFSEDWKIFLANIKYATNSYKDANEYANILNKIFNQEQNHMEIDNEDTASTSNENVTESTCLTTDISTMLTHSSGSKPISMASEQPESTVQVEPEETTASKMLLTNTARSLDQTVKQYSEKLSSCLNDINEIRHNQKTLVTTPKSMNQCQIIAFMRKIFGNNYERLKKLHSQFDQQHKNLQKLCLAFGTQSKVLKDMLELIDKIENDSDESDVNALVEKILRQMKNNRINKANVVTNEVTGSEKKVTEQKRNVKVTESEIKTTEQKEELKQNDKVTGSETKHTEQKEERKQNDNNKNNPLNKIRGQARKFTLPPEYDPRDSRWTLKHREKKKGLVELMPYSDVYVNAIQLNYSKIMSKDSKKLARMLLVEIFNESALSVCTISGRKSNAFDREGNNVRPGLNKHATDVLLNFVEEYALKKKWTREDSAVISNSIRNKIQDIRYRHNSNTSEYKLR